MMDLLNIISLIIGILGLCYAFYTSILFSSGVKIGALRSIRTLINRMEEDKSMVPKDSSEWLTMHHTQQNLEDLHKNLQSMFNVTSEIPPKE